MALQTREPLRIPHLILYRSAMTDPVTLTLTGTPVDGEHAPQLGQGVEIGQRGRSRQQQFHCGAPGFVTTAAQAYNFDTGELGLADPLPAKFQAGHNPSGYRS